MSHPRLVCAGCGELTAATKPVCDDCFPKFDRQHPEVFAQIKAELIEAGEPTQQRLLEVSA